MLFWKALAAFDVLLTFGFLRAAANGSHRLKRSDAFFAPVALAGTCGVISYAFGIDMAPAELWRWIFALILASAAWEIGSAWRDGETGEELYTAAAIAIVTLFAGTTSVALFRLGGSVWPWS